MDNTILKIAIEASIEAGMKIMEIYSGNFDVFHKEDDSPLTNADQKANTTINSYLDKTDYPIISEENKLTDYAIRRHWDTCWIVDPLDGTKEFIKRNGEFTVNIALVKEGTPVLGVIYVPVTKELFFTAADMGTSHHYIVNDTSYDLDSIVMEAKSIAPAKLEPNDSIKIVGSRSHLNPDTQNFVKEKQETSKVEIVSKGSSLKFCLVAEGKAHLYPRFAPTMEWDTAAGQAICKAVGVQVIDQTTNQPLTYNKENLLNPYFLVGL